jgi:hypothetical protein
MRWKTLVAVALVTACGSGDAEGVPHVRLGMAPRDVRERFAPGGEGTWQTALGAGDDTAIEWTARDVSSSISISRARFEFHLGMLVAIRAHSAEKSSREKVSTTRKTVTLRAPAPEGGTSVTVLARDCPTHRDEAERYAARAN